MLLPQPGLGVQQHESGTNTADIGVCNFHTEYFQSSKFFAPQHFNCQQRNKNKM